MISIYNIETAKKFENNSEWDEAIVIYKKLIEKNDLTSYIEKLGWCQSRAGKYDDAIESFSKIKLREPKMAKWSYMIGYQYYCKKNWKKAIDFFEEALNIKPDYFIVKYRISYAYVQLSGKYKRSSKPEFWKAIAHLEECEKIWNKFNPQKKIEEKNTYFDINFLHGKIIMELPKYRDYSIVKLKKALEVKKDDNCQYNLAKVYYLNGQYDEAKNNIPQNDNYYVLELKAYNEAKLGNYEESINIVENLLKTRKKDYLYAFLAEVYLLKSDNEKAYHYANKAIKKNYSNHKNHYSLAKVYYSFNLYSSAISELVLAIDLKIKNYKSEYEEAVKLKQEIEKLIPCGYVEDKIALNNLKNIDFKYKNTGNICEYNNEKGYGFIEYNKKKIFFHISDCEFSNPLVGMYVYFNILKDNNSKSKAVNVIEIN